MLTTRRPRGTSQETLLRGFIPFLPSYNPSIGGFDCLGPGAVKAMPMCSATEGVDVTTPQGLTLGRTDNYEVGVYPVGAGDELQTVRPASRPTDNSLHQPGLWWTFACRLNWECWPAGSPQHAASGFRSASSTWLEAGVALGLPAGTTFGKSSKFPRLGWKPSS